MCIIAFFVSICNYIFYFWNSAAYQEIFIQLTRKKCVSVARSIGSTHTFLLTGLSAAAVIPSVADLCASLQFGTVNHMAKRLYRALLFCDMNQLLPKTNRTLVGYSIDYFTLSEGGGLFWILIKNNFYIFAILQVQ